MKPLNDVNDMNVRGCCVFLFSNGGHLILWLLPLAASECTVVLGPGFLPGRDGSPKARERETNNLGS